MSFPLLVIFFDIRIVLFKCVIFKLDLVAYLHNAAPG